MDKKIRLGIIGLGNMGSGHARSIMEGKCPDFELVAVADINPARVEWGKANLAGNIRYFDDALAMLDSGCIDACMVCVPHYDHPRYAMACMQRGIHVMVEKPAGVYTKQVRERHEEACIITDWYRPQAYYDSGAWRATWSGEGGGVLLNQCPHQLDLWQWICGMPVSVLSQMRFGQWHDIEVEDDVTTYVEYANGATGVFVTTTGDAHGTNRFEIQMDRAKLVVEDGQLHVLEFEVSEPEWSRTNKAPFATMPAHEVAVETDGKNEQHVGVINAWGGAILRGTPLVAHGSEGIYGLTLSNAMHLSAFLGKKVELPLDEDLFYTELMKRVATSRRKADTQAVFADTSSTYGGNR